MIQLVEEGTMIGRLRINSNEFMKNSMTMFYHQFYTGYKKPDNPNFLNLLKNTFNGESSRNLNEARNEVTRILTENIPEIMEERNVTECVLVCVPRAKSLKTYSNSQLMFKNGVKLAAENIKGAIDGTDFIKRTIDTCTTHLRFATQFSNNGDLPYPGITIATCEINQAKIVNQTVILIDDIYTRNVNIDEDCIQALLDNGAKKVIFYAVGYTRRD